MVSNQKRIVTLIASCLIAFCLGAVFTWSVFTAPLAERLNEINGFTGEAALTAGSLSIVFSTYNLLSIVAMMIGGAINDKYGPKIMIAIAGILMCIGYVGCGMATSVTMLIISFGVIICMGVASSYSCVLNNAVKFFPEKRGLASGLVLSFYGLGTVVLSPVASSLIKTIGVSKVFFGYGVAFLIILLVGSVVVTRAPAAPAPAAAAAVSSNDKNWKEMIRDPRFYIMVVILGAGAYFGMMVTSEVSAISTQRMGFEATHAAAMASVIAGCGICGRLICGSISDKIGRLNTITGALVLSLVGLVGLMNTAAGADTLFTVSIGILGFCYGAILSCYPGFTADQFGAANNSLNYGIIWLGYSICGFISPTLTSSIKASTGDFNGAFMAAAGVSVLGIVMTVIFRGVAKKQAAKAAADQ